VIVRAVSSLDELDSVFDFVCAQLAAGITHENRRYQDLARRFESDRSLMLVAEDCGRVVGGALMFKSTLRVIALESVARGQGVGRRLLQAIEEEAARLGRGRISVGVGPGPSPARDFFTHMGYAGRSRMEKQLSLSPYIPSGETWRRRLDELRARRAHRLAAQ
jgi:GNAT superfamily N-acetyltransferase